MTSRNETLVTASIATVGTVVAAVIAGLFGLLGQDERDSPAASSSTPATAPSLPAAPSTPVPLGGLLLNDYCAAHGYPDGSFYTDDERFNWHCGRTGKRVPIDMDLACKWQYRTANIRARYVERGRRWECVAESKIVTGGP